MTPATSTVSEDGAGLEAGTSLPEKGGDWFGGGGAYWEAWPIGAGLSLRRR